MGYLELAPNTPHHAPFQFTETGQSFNTRRLKINFERLRELRPFDGLIPQNSAHRAILAEQRDRWIEFTNAYGHRAGPLTAELSWFASSHWESAHMYTDHWSDETEYMAAFIGFAIDIFGDVPSFYGPMRMELFDGL